MSAIINTIYVFSLSGFIHYLKLNKKVNWVKSCFATCDKDELFLGKNVLNARITQEQFVEEMKTPIELIDALVNHKMPESLSKVKHLGALELIKKCLQPELFRVNINELLTDPIFAENTEKPVSQTPQTNELILV